ncbi:DNA-binding protein RFX6 [Caerostris darwini]|uniref:DNA-binding protein RFX6 n=1 Tax=Caerostris darwini TaxID=1538125 RepID=A0AAV4S1T6_9ARAC|nr:DNA-binding protein RFX6 [Caerostris darwini]
MDSFFDRSFQIQETYQIQSIPSSDASTLSVNTVHFNEKKDFARKPKDKKGQSIMKTIKWLRANYCSCPEVCLPREIIYDHYLEFCRNEKISSACKATFGKLIRNTFPEVTSKRLGARGHSKYHYNGIAIKQNSEQFNSTQIKNGITRFSCLISSKNEQAFPKKFSLASKVGMLLPNFPEAADLIIPNSELKEKIGVFLTMYRMHCQCIVDVAISGNFEEIRLFLLHFWQGFPDHLNNIFEHPVTLDLIQVCDVILHRTLVDILIPSELIDVPERLLRGIQNIALHWKKWLECSLENMSSQLKQIKVKQAERFTQVLKRYVAFLLLQQVARPVLSKYALHLLSEELNEVEEDGFINDSVLQIDQQTIINLFPNSDSDIKIIPRLQKLFENECFIETLIKWLDSMIRKIVEKNQKFTDNARCSILYWIYILSKISYWMTENKSDNFITFHLFSCLLQEYLLLAFENQQAQEQEQVIYKKMEKHLNNSDKKTANYFKSATSCFMVNTKKQMHSKYKNNLKDNYGLQQTRNELKEDKMSIKEQDKTDPSFPELSSTYLVRNEICFPDCYNQQSVHGLNNKGYTADNIISKFPQTCTSPSAPLLDIQLACDMYAFQESWLTKDLGYGHPFFGDQT